MKVQPSLKLLVKNNVQLESSAQILVLNFIIALLASNTQTFTLPFVAGPSTSLLLSNQGHAGHDSIWFLITKLSVAWEQMLFGTSCIARVLLLTLITKSGWPQSQIRVRVSGYLTPGTVLLAS